MGAAAPRAPDGVTARYARVVVEGAPAHLDRPFDYAVPDGVELGVGRRVRVVFNGRRATGWVAAISGTTDVDPARIREVAQVDGEATWFDADDLDLWRWVADRFAASLASVVRHALPKRVQAVESEAARWPPATPPVPSDRPPCAVTAWRPYDASALLRATADASAAQGSWWLRTPADADEPALVADLVTRCLASGRSALICVPDPASPVAAAALDAAGSVGADWRSVPGRSAGAEARARHRSFLRARAGLDRVVVGERAAVFAPVRDLGLIVVADEANPAHKERRAPRHHVREVALARAHMVGASGLVLGDLPSAALVELCDAGHVTEVAADRTTERDGAPRVDVVDLDAQRPGARSARFAEPTQRAISEVVRSGGAVVVLAARGGQGSALACRRCRERRRCVDCDGSLRVARAADELPDGHWVCGACGWTGPPSACPECRSEAHSPLAAGAGRLATELASSFPAAEVVRMEGFDAPGPTRRPAIAVMTRGSVVGRPAWLGDERALVVMGDADAFVNRPSVDATEDALRLAMATGRWASRIVVQTREPLHPALQALVRWDAHGWWARERVWRGDLGWPPALRLIAITAPDAVADEVGRSVRTQLTGEEVVLGPDQSGALLVKTPGLRGTLSALAPLRAAWAKDHARVRIDVDPVDAG